DREGNIWVGHTQGLERLRDSPFVTLPIPGLKSQSPGALYVDPSGKTWFSPIAGGLRWQKGTQGGTVTIAGIPNDTVYSIAGSDNNVWIGRERGGLTRLHLAHGSWTAKSYTQADGLAQNSVYAVYQARDGTVWSGTFSGGVSELRNNHFINYTKADGLASNTVISIAEGNDGTIWFGTPNGLTAKSKDGWRTYLIRDAFSQDVNCILQDSTGVLWIGTAEGLAFLNGGYVQMLHDIPDSLHEPIFGIAEDTNRRLWVATANHVLRVKGSSLLNGTWSQTEVRAYGLEDGLHGTEGVKRFRSVIADSQGRVWFSTNRGLSVLNVSRATFDSLPALVQVQGVLADGNPLNVREPLRVSAGNQRTTFRYAGLSLGNPERVRYRYRLDSFDRGWIEGGTNQEATYVNLGAGSYRFRVIACNSDGLWNGSEAAVSFEILPAVWQTWWFRLSCVLCAGLAAFMMYHLRI